MMKKIEILKSNMFEIKNLVQIFKDELKLVYFDRNETKRNKLNFGLFILSSAYLIIKVNCLSNYSKAFIKIMWNNYWIFYFTLQFLDADFSILKQYNQSIFQLCWLL